MHRFHLLKIKVLGFIRYTLASHICSTDSIPWVHHSREEGSLDYDGGFVCLQVPFSGEVVGEQVIKIQSFIAFCVIFSFLLVFIFASTNF
jgi:hypothetical protein